MSTFALPERQTNSGALKWVKTISIVIVLASCSVLIGWTLDITALRTILPELGVMKSNTSLAFLLSAVALWLIPNLQTVLQRHIAQACAIIVLVIGLLTGAEYLFGWELGIDHLLIRNDVLTTNVSMIRMSSATAIAFILLGITLLLLLNTHRYFLVQFIALMILGIGLLVFAGYLFSVSSLHSVLLFNTITLPTAITFCAVAFAIFLTCSHEGFIAVISQNNLGGLMARRLLPVAIIVPLAVGWLRLQGQYRGYYGTEFGLAIYAISNIVIVTLVVWWTAHKLNQIDLDNQITTTKVARYGQRMTLLHHIDAGIIAAKPVPELIKETIHELRELIPCQRIAVILVDEVTQELVIYAEDSDVENPFNTMRLPPSPDLFATFAVDHTCYYEDLREVQDRYDFAKNAIKRGLLSLFQVEFILDGHPVGLLNLSAKDIGFFTPEYREIAVEVTNQLAIVMKQLQASENIQTANINLERYAQRMEILHNIDRGIIASVAMPDLINRTLKSLRKLIPCERIAINLMDEATQEIVIYAADSELEPLNITHTKILPFMLEGFDEHNTRHIEDLRALDQNPLARVFLEKGFHTLFQVLLIQEGCIEGTVSLASTKLGFFTTEYREIITEVSDQLSVAVKQLRLTSAIQKANDTLEQRVIERTAELNAAKEKVEAILNNSLDGIILSNIDLDIEKANPAFEKLFRQTVNDQQHLSLLDVIHHDDTNRVVNSVQTALAGTTSNTVEVLARKGDGSTFEVELSIGHVIGDGLVSTIHDISNRKAAERQLRYHASIQNTVADAVIATDLEFVIQSWNKAAERIYGWREEEVIGKPIRDVLQTEITTHQLVDEVRQVFIEKGHWKGEVDQRHRNGHIIHTLSSSVLFKDTNGNPFGVLIVNHDISERKQAEDALRTALAHEKEVNEMKTRFISIASHEFRTPLASISATTETLMSYRDKMKPEQIEERLSRILQQVTHVTSIMNDVLESARIQGDYLNFKPAQSNLDVLLRDIVQEFVEHPEYVDRIQYACENPHQLSRFDARLMRQIVSNMLSNALKYSPPDYPVLVNLIQTDQDVAITVIDRGIGIPEGDLQYVFEPFHRAMNVGDISGTGLGMSITKKAVEMHKGTISVASVVGQGSTFTVVIPMLSA